MIDEGDADCYGPPEADAGPDVQDLYLGGTIVVVLDASETTDPNPGDVLQYTWTQVGATPAGATVSLQTDPASPLAYLQFQAEPSETVEWVFEFQVVVSDGVAETEDDVDTASVRIFRPATVPAVACSASAGRPAVSGFALLVVVALSRRRR